MYLVLCSLGILIISGILSLSLNRSARSSNYIGAAGAVLACVTGIISLITVCTSRLDTVLSIPWPVPYGTFCISVDALGALFLFLILIVAAVSALYGIDYLKHYYGKRNIGSAWFSFNVLVAGMILVVLARNAVLFLVAWELMSVSSFFLVLFDREKKEAAKAGMVYLIATHIGTLFLMVMFILLAKNSGSFDFSSWQPAFTGIMPSIIFLCALAGFGTKAGFMPMHIWLPEAHPAAPSHVSAVMSGVMIKMGIYGILRILTFLGTPCSSWGYLMIGIGAISGVLGILFALAQHDLKRLLAYSSIENMGIIAMGTGLGILGMSVNNMFLTVLGFTGGLLHAVNHAFFKTLLFLGAGAVYHETGTREMNLLGGLLRKMPIAGACFLIGAAAICGLPPLNGFISEFLLYFASFKNIFGTTEMVIVSMSMLISLALIGGLAAACFTKAFGIIFLGEPRSRSCENSREPGIFTRISMLILAGACIITGACAPFIIKVFGKVTADITKAPLSASYTELSGLIPSLTYILIAALFLVLTVMLTVVLRYWLLKNRQTGRVLTWDCGYAVPGPRMQYTASSYAQPLINFFKGVLRTHKHAETLDEYFPDNPSFRTETSDLFNETVFRPTMRFINHLAKKITWVQHGQLQFYILYILFTLVALLIWGL